MPTSVPSDRLAPAGLEPIALQAWRRGLAMLKLLVQVVIEAREMQRTARSRYPFVDW